MMNSEEEEKLTCELMKKSGREMPFVDFEEKLMEKIHNEEKITRSFLKDVKLSWLFFIIGSCFGLFLSVISSQINNTVWGIHAQQITMLIQVVFVVLLLCQFDNLIKLSRKQN